MSIIRNIKLDYKNFHLNIPELEIPNDGITAVWGKSGSGKTTLMNILVGITQAEGWSWLFDGLDLAKVSPSERHIGIVFQTYDLFPHLTAEENILIVARSRYKSSSSFEQKLIEIQTVKERLNLSNCWKTKAENLSGGEKQRVALMRAIFSDPRIIILDEPFSALDENMRKESRSLLKSVLSDLNIPVLLITHDQNDVDELCTNKIELFDGQIRRV